MRPKIAISTPYFFCAICSFPLSSHFDLPFLSLGKLANSAAIASCSGDRDRVACVFASYNSSKEVATKKLDPLAAKDDFHVGITLVFMKSRKATAHLQVRHKGFG